MSNLISIIIPIYNIAPYLDRCISSVINQTYRNLQIILVDDGSTDGSTEICDQYAKRDERICVIHKSNGGLVSARKAGIQVATGEYVSYVDGDDWIESDMLEHLYDAARESGAEVVCAGHFVDINKNSKIVKNKFEQGVYLTQDVRKEILYKGCFFESGITPYIWSKFFRTEIIKEKQCLVDDHINVGEDLAVGLPVVLDAERIHILDYAGYHYVQRGNSMIHCREGNDTARSTHLLTYLKQYLEKEKDGDILLKQLGQYAKSLFLQRHIEWFDRKSNMILTPYGGIPYGSTVVIYGAGILGQGIYQYLMDTKKVKIAGWYDKEFETYRQEGYQVQNPNEIKACDFDFIIVSVISESVAKMIARDLAQLGISKEKVHWLTDEFIDEKNTLVFD